MTIVSSVSLCPGKIVTIKIRLSGKKTKESGKKKIFVLKVLISVLNENLG